MSSNRPYHHTLFGFRNPPGSAPFYRFTADVAKEVVNLALDMRRLVIKKDRLLTGWIEPQNVAYDQMMQVSDKDSAITWLGHASFLVHMDGIKILTDPFLTSYASPLPVKSLKRIVPSAVPVEKLPAIHVIALSHNHYDHMDAKALKLLARLQPGILVVVPLGLKKPLLEFGFKRVVELDWYESIDEMGASITAVPAIHFSRRGLFDTNRTLWCGFVIRKKSRSVYFAGDTAYGPVFKEIGDKFGPIDIGLIPIGAYKPQEIMSSVHVCPEEGIKIGEDLKVKQMIGMHWGTIRLTSEPMLEPAQRFMQADTVLNRVLLKIGETRLFEEMSPPSSELLDL